jgi:hypothetical protein
MRQTGDRPFLADGSVQAVFFRTRQSLVTVAGHLLIPPATLIIVIIRVAFDVYNLGIWGLNHTYRARFARKRHCQAVQYMAVETFPSDEVKVDPFRK